MRHSNNGPVHLTALRRQYAIAANPEPKRAMLAGSGFVTVGLPPSEPSKPPPLPPPEIPLPAPEKENEELPSLNDPAEPAPKDPDEPDDPNDPPEEPPPKNSSRKEPALDPLHPAVRNATVSKING